MNTEGFDYDIYSLSSYDYYLPEELIAQSPVDKRDESRLLVLNKSTGKITDEQYFYNDNGKETVINAGAVAITPAGTGHSIKNESNEDVELIALIIYS